MSNVIRFRFKDGSRVVFNAKKKKSGSHRITVRVTDPVNPEDIRELVQRRISRAAGFKANRGFTDVVAKHQADHKFIASRNLTARFVQEILPFVTNGTVVVFIDGMALKRIRVA